VCGPAISWVASVIDDEAHPQPIDAEDFILNTIKAGRLKEWVEDVRSGKRIKKTLPAVMFGGKFSARGDANLTQHSGLFGGDLDNLGDELPSVRKKLESSKYAYAVFASAGGNGLSPYSGFARMERNTQPVFAQ
jgi:VirE-like protein